MNIFLKKTVEIYFKQIKKLLQFLSNFYGYVSNLRFIWNSFFDKDHIFNGQRALFGLIQSHIDGGLPVSINEIRSSINVLGKTDQFYA